MHARAWRGAGGIAVYVSETLMKQGVETWKEGGLEGRIWVRFRKQGPNGEDLFLCSIYLPPEGSTWYVQTGRAVEEVFEELEQEISKAMSQGVVLIAGDLNARIGIEENR